MNDTTAVAETTVTNLPVTGAAASAMAMIERAATNPAVEVDKMERLFALYERIQAQEAKSAYAAALAVMMPELPDISEKGKIKNNAGTVQSTYALWEDVNEAIKPVLSKHGFAISFRVGNSTDKISVTGVLTHAHGHAEETTLTLPVDMSGSKNGVQGIGSSTSYGKRYTAGALLNLTSRGEDDDGQAGGRGGSALVQTANTAINMCNTVAELQEWKRKNEAGLKEMPQPDADAVVRLFNSRLKKMRDHEKGEA